MVFAHVIEPFPEGRPLFPMTGNSKQAVGDMVLQSQMVGMLNVISGLAEYTNQVFSSLLKESAGKYFLLVAFLPLLAFLSLQIIRFLNGSTITLFYALINTQ